MKPDSNPVDEIYVDTRDASTLREILATVAHPLEVGDDDRDDALGLTRLVLRNAAAAMAQLPDLPPPPSRSAELKKDAKVVVLPTDIDPLLDLVRKHARENYGRWLPTFDRNHDVGDHATNPHVKIDDRGEPPVPADRPNPIPARSAVGPRVGIADARVYPHPDFAGHFLADPLVSPGAPPQSQGHATFVAGTVLRRAPSASLMCVTVLVHDELNTSWAVAKRLMQLRGTGIEILNMSFGCKVDSAPPLPLERALALLGADVLLVAAAGNQGNTSDPRAAMYPAAFGGVTAVGAANDVGDIASATPNVPWLDLLAPGENVVGAFLPGDVELDDGSHCDFGGGYATWSGSSFAAAAVTGEIASMMHTEHIDAFAARDRLLCETLGDAKGDIVGFQSSRAAAARG